MSTRIGEYIRSNVFAYLVLFLGRWRIPATLAIIGTAFGLVASSASASFLYQRSSANPPTNTLVYAGLTNNEVNSVTLERNAGGEFVFTDATTLIDDGMPSICRAGVGPNQVICATEDSPGSPFTSVDFELHNNNDYVNNRINLPSRIEGGGGADILNGGGGPDVILGDGDFDPDNPDGDDTIAGRGGADNMNGDGGIDTVTYAGTTPSVFVSIDGVANDGFGGEGDNVQLTVENVVGSKSSDQLTGSNAANVLTGGLGGDQLDGLVGDDQLNGGDGNDDLDGGVGLDRLSGQNDADVLSGGLDADRLFGGEGYDGAIGGPGADFISGGGGTDDYVDYSTATAPLRVTVPDGLANDGATGERDNVQSDTEVIFGGSGDDRLYGTDNGGEVWGRAGDDLLFGGDNDDRLEGEDGDDRLEGGYRGDLMSGGNGIDTVDFTSHWFDDGFDVSGVSSTPNGVADDGNFLIDEGLAGTDNVGSDVENVLGSGGPDYIEGTADVNRLRGAGHNDRLLGMGANDILDGDSGDDRLEGGTEDDLLRGGDQTDRLFGGNDDDTLDGGTGPDVLNGQADEDTITYAGRAGRVAVTLDEVRNDGADPNGNGSSTVAEEGDLDRDVENVTGGDGDDILRALVADAVVNVLRGALGNDTLDVREGTGTIDGLVCGPGTDSFAKDPSDTQNTCENALP